MDDDGLSSSSSDFELSESSILSESSHISCESRATATSSDEVSASTNSSSGTRSSTRSSSSSSTISSTSSSDEAISRLKKRIGRPRWARKGGKRKKKESSARRVFVDVELFGHTDVSPDDSTDSNPASKRKKKQAQLRASRAHRSRIVSKESGDDANFSPRPGKISRTDRINPGRAVLDSRVVPSATAVSPAPPNPHKKGKSARCLHVKHAKKTPLVRGADSLWPHKFIADPHPTSRVRAVPAREDEDLDPAISKVVHVQKDDVLVSSVDPRKMRTQTELRFEHHAPVYAVAVSPSGRYLATGGADHRVTIWDLRNNGKLIAEMSTPGTHPVIVYALAFQVGIDRQESPLLACGCQNGWVGVVSLRYARAEEEWPLTHRFRTDIRAIAVSRDGETVAVGGEGALFALLNARKSREAGGDEPRLLPGHTHTVRAVSYTSDGKWLISGDSFRRLIIRDTHTGLIAHTITQPGPIYGIDVSECGRWVAVAGGALVNILSIAYGTVVHSLPHNRAISTALSRHTDGGRLLGFSSSEISNQQGLVCFEIAAELTLIKEKYAVGGGGAASLGLSSLYAPSVAVSRDGRWTVHAGSRLRAGDLSDPLQKSELTLLISGQDLKKLDRFSESDPQVIVLARKDREWAVVGRTEVVKDNPNPKFSTFVALDYSPEKTQKLRFVVLDVDDPDKNWFDNDVIGELETTLKEIVDSQKGSHVSTLSRKLHSASYKKPGRITVSARESGEEHFVPLLRITDMVSGVLVIDEKADSQIWSVSISDDGNLFAYGGRDKKLSVRDLPDGKEKHLFKHSGAILTSAFAPSGKFVVVGGEDLRATAWSLVDGTNRECFQKHNGVVRAVAVSPDCTEVASGGSDRKLILWKPRFKFSGGVVDDTPDAPPPPPRVFALGGILRFCAFSPDGKLIASGGDDNRLSFRDRADGSILFEFQYDYSCVSGCFSHDSEIFLSANGSTISVYSVPDRAYLCSVDLSVGNNWEQTTIRTLAIGATPGEANTYSSKGFLAVSVGEQVRVLNLGGFFQHPSPQLLGDPGFSVDGLESMLTRFPHAPELASPRQGVTLMHHLARAGGNDRLAKLKMICRQRVRGSFVPVTTLWMYPDAHKHTPLNVALKRRDRETCRLLTRAALNFSGLPRAEPFGGAPDIFPQLLQIFPDLAAEVIEGALVDVTPPEGYHMHFHVKDGDHVSRLSKSQNGLVVWRARLKDRHVAEYRGKASVEPSSLFLSKFTGLGEYFPILAELAALERSTVASRVFSSMTMRSLAQCKWKEIKVFYKNLFSVYLFYTIFATTAYWVSSLAWEFAFGMHTLDLTEFSDLFRSPNNMFVRTFEFGNGWGILSTVLMGLLVPLSLTHLCGELWRLYRRGLERYVAVWNMINLAAAVMTVASSILFFVWPLLSRYFQAFSVMLLWLGGLGIQRAFPNSGPYVYMLVSVARDLYAFLKIFSFIMVGFIAAFVVLLPGTDAFRGFNAVSTTIRMAITNFNDSDFQPDPLATALMLIFLFAVVITMINLLIAVVSDTFDRIRGQEQAEAVAQLADTVSDIQRDRRSIGNPYLDSRAFLHIAARVNASGAWGGRVAAVVDEVEKSHRKTMRAISAVDDPIRDMQRSLAELKHSVDALDRRVSADVREHDHGIYLRGTALSAGSLREASPFGRRRAPELRP